MAAIKYISTISFKYLRDYLKEILISCYLLLHYDEVSSRILNFDNSLKIIFYIGLFTISALALYMSAYIKSRVLRFFYGFALFLSSVLFDTYTFVTASSLNYNSYISLLNAQTETGYAISQYTIPLSLSIIIGLFLLLGIILKPKRSVRVPNIYAILYPPMVLLLIVFLVFSRGGDGETGLPPAFLTLTYSVLTTYEKVVGTISERKGVEIEREEVEVEKDIILIVDESIAPRYLDINSKSGIKTNLLHKYSDIDIYNYGYAASITTCSTESNLSLRFGGTRENYADASLNMPSIWRYAKQANLRTVYLDTQGEKDSLINKMTSTEMADIDDFIQFYDIDVVDRDLAAAEKLVELINNDSQDFIYLNKVGGHFPVHDKYPDEFLIYKPILPRGKYSNITDEGIANNNYFSSSIENWIRYRNSYRNTLLWNVGNFFKQILSKADLENATIIYTSDHGQNLHEDKSPGLATHCTNTQMLEGVVPLVVIESKNQSLQWESHHVKNMNQSSHFNIFPTLLALMKYKRESVSEYYGVALDQETKDEMTFNTNYHARLGGSAEWMKINLEKIVNPSECDFENCD